MIEYAESTTVFNLLPYTFSRYSLLLKLAYVSLTDVKTRSRVSLSFVL